MMGGFIVEQTSWRWILWSCTIAVSTLGFSEETCFSLVADLSKSLVCSRSWGSFS